MPLSRRQISGRLPAWIYAHGPLLALAAVALALRVAAVVLLSHSESGTVTYEHGEIAANLMAGRGFAVTFLGSSGPTSQQAPLYPAALAGLYAIFGVGSQSALMAMQLAQCVAGALTVMCVARLAWSLLPQARSIGWAAAVLAAIHPVHIYMVTHIQVVTWSTLGITLLVALAARREHARSWRRAMLLGITAGALLLLDPIFAIAMPLVALAYWQSTLAHETRLKVLSDLHDDSADSAQRFRSALSTAVRPLQYVAVMALVASAVVAPWIWRNYRVHGELVFVKSTFGYAFWQGNNAASWGTDKIPKAEAAQMANQHDGSLAGMNRALWAARHETLYIDDVLLAPQGYERFKGLSEPARSRVLEREAWAFIRANPRRYVALCLQRLRYFWFFDETNPKAANPIYRITTVVTLVLAFIGGLVSAPWWRRMWPTYGVCAAICLFHTLTITSSRFRIPIEPLVLVWCGAAVGPLVARWLPGISRSASPATLTLPAAPPSDAFGLERRRSA